MRFSVSTAVVAKNATTESGSNSPDSNMLLMCRDMVDLFRWYSVAIWSVVSHTLSSRGYLGISKSETDPPVFRGSEGMSSHWQDFVLSGAGRNVFHALGEYRLCCIGKRNPRPCGRGRNHFVSKSCPAGAGRYPRFAWTQQGVASMTSTWKGSRRRVVGLPACAVAGRVSPLGELRV